MGKSIDGIIPLMITPFTDDDRIDYAGLERLIEWYLEHQADALFAVCQSSEMQFLSLRERRNLGTLVEFGVSRLPRPHPPAADVISSTYNPPL